MKKRSEKAAGTDFKRMEHRVSKGIRGVYTSLAFKLKRLVLPVVLAVCFGALAYLSVDNALRSSSAYGVDTVTVYCKTDYESVMDKLYRVFAKKAGVTLGYEEFCQHIDIRFANKRQRLTIMENYDKSDGTDSPPSYILINENNEFVSAYTDFDELLIELVELGYLEEQ